MAVSLLDSLIMLLRYILTLGALALAVLLFWHLQRINKPTIALFFWCVVMLSALTPLLNVIQAGISLKALSPLWIVWIFVLPSAVGASYFYNPLRPKRYSYEDDDMDTPTYH